MSLTVLNVSYNQLSGFLTSVLSGSVFATENVLCYAGPPLHEALKLLAPLANLEELSLGGNALGGTITADVEVFTKLKKLYLHRMGLDGKRLSTRSERFILATEIDVCAGPLPKVLQARSRRCNSGPTAFMLATATSSRVGFRPNGRVLQI